MLLLLLLLMCPPPPPLHSWVRSIAFDPGSEWFCTGSSGRTIKLWDTASGQLKLTLMGHIEQVTGLAVSARSPHMFSCSLDKQAKCWDLEQNKVGRGGVGPGIADRSATEGCNGGGGGQSLSIILLMLPPINVLIVHPAWPLVDCALLVCARQFA